MRLIDADALLQKRCHAKNFATQPEVYVIGQGYVMDAPTLGTEARWKGAGMGDYICSFCWGRGYEEYKFCPRCGAVMD